MAIGEKVKGLTSSAKRRVGAEAPLAADEDGKIGVVRGALRAFGEGDMEGFADALKDDVHLESPEAGNFPGGGDHQGAEEVRTNFIGDVGRTYTSFGFVPESFLETDKEDAVVVIGRFTAESVEGGTEVDVPGVQIWGFTGTEVTHVRIFTDSAAFPDVITEKKEKEQQEKEEKEKRKEEEGDSEDDGGAKGESDDDTKSESKDDTATKSKDDDDSDDDDDSGDDTKGESNKDPKGEADADADGSGDRDSGSGPSDDSEDKPDNKDE